MSRGFVWNRTVSKLLQIAFISIYLFSTKYHCQKSTRASCFYDNHKYRHREKFSPDGDLCETCHCNNGEVACSFTSCPDITSCRKEDIVKHPDECCPKCSKASAIVQGTLPIETTPTSNLFVVHLPPPPMLPPPPPSIAALFSANQSQINPDQNSNSKKNTCYLDDSKVLLECIGESGDPIILRGPPGPTGQPGSKGDRGKRGKRGEKGDVGPKGMSGPIGPQGSIGLPGERGEIGNRGKKGDKGEPGDKVVGVKGERGPIGPPGYRGPAGPRGETGPSGSRGFKGEKGEPHCVPGVVVVPDAPSMNEITTEGMLAYCQGDQKLYFRDRSSWRTVQMDDPSRGHYETTSKENNKLEEVIQLGASTKCGNGKVEPGEQCDDGNTDKSDNCVVRNSTTETDTANSTDFFPATSGNAVTRWRCSVFTTVWTTCIVLAIASCRLPLSLLR